MTKLVRIVGGDPEAGISAVRVNHELREMEELGYKILSIQVYQTTMGPQLVIFADNPVPLHLVDEKS